MHPWKTPPRGALRYSFGCLDPEVLVCSFETWLTCCCGWSPSGRGLYLIHFCICMPGLSWIHQNIRWMVVECVNKWVSFLKFIIIRNSSNFGGSCKPPLYFPQNGFFHVPLNLGAFILLERYTQKHKKDETTQFMCEIRPSFTRWPLLSLCAVPFSVLKSVLFPSLRWKQMASQPGGKHLASASWPVSPQHSHHAWGDTVTSLAFKVFLLGYPFRWQSVWAARCPCHGGGRGLPPTRIRFCLDKSRLREGLFARFPRSSTVSSCPALSSLPVITHHWTKPQFRE